MNAIADMPDLSGIEQLRAIFAGRTGYEGIVKTLDIRTVSAEEGFVTFDGSPTRAAYNPIGSVHGGYAATLLDTVMGCAVHSRLTNESASRVAPQPAPSAIRTTATGAPNLPALPHRAD